jgi:hypothetical protein
VRAAQDVGRAGEARPASACAAIACGSCSRAEAVRVVLRVKLDPDKLTAEVLRPTCDLRIHRHSAIWRTARNRIGTTSRRGRRSEIRRMGHIRIDATSRGAGRARGPRPGRRR